MILRIDQTSAIPPFEQIRSQIALMVSAGRLRAGHRLPTVRGLAGDLGVSAGTVARAYRELESSGLVVGRGRQGTFVAAEPEVEWSASERTRQVRDAANEFVALARRLGIDDRAVLDAVTEALDRPGNADHLTSQE